MGTLIKFISVIFSFEYFRLHVSVQTFLNKAKLFEILDCLTQILRMCYLTNIATKYRGLPKPP